jgi:4-aminobutyrate aminotransferase-like enzyme
LATIETIEDEGLLQRAEHIGQRFRDRFEKFRERCPLIQQVRVKGTMIGIELSTPGSAVVDACLQRQLLINCTHTTVLRLLPALTLTDDLIDEGCNILEEVLLGYKA